MSASENKKSIRISVSLDKDNIPTKILWTADDLAGSSNANKWEEAEAISIGVWNEKELKWLHVRRQNMEVKDMQWYNINMLRALCGDVLEATGDEKIARIMKVCSEQLAEYCAKQSPPTEYIHGK